LSWIASSRNPEITFSPGSYSDKLEAVHSRESQGSVTAEQETYEAATSNLLKSTVPLAFTIPIQVLENKSSEKQNTLDVSQEPQLKESSKPSSDGHSDEAQHIVLAGTSIDVLGLDGGTMRRRMQGWNLQNDVPPKEVI
jgi:hypothetical protein